MFLFNLNSWHVCISDERKKVAVILSVMGAKEYRLLKSVVAPQKVSELTLKEVDEALKEHYNPKPPVMLERYKFYQRNQRADENIATYYAELKKMAETCDFSTFRKEALRDRFVCGLAEESVQRRLLSEDDITIEKAVKLATSMEAASKGTAALKTLEQKSSTSTTVNYGEIECYCCGKKGHTKKQCRYRELSCDNCHRKGHLKQVCKNSKKGSSRSQNNPKSTLVSGRDKNISIRLERSLDA